MTRNPWALGAAAVGGMLALILDGRTALAGAQAGLRLCLETMIPSLFPFFVLSGVVLAAFSGGGAGLLRPLGRMLGLAPGLEAMLIPAFLGGYPVGAQAVAAQWRAGTLEKGQAEKLLAFCSNAGPAFLFGICAPMFPARWMGWALWGIHILSAVMAARLLPPGDAPAPARRREAPSFANVLPGALGAMGSVCGWVILFRVLIAFLEKWVLWLLPLEGQTAIIGLLELGNGCAALAGIESVPLRFCLCSVFLALGGLCVAMQTASVTAGLSIRRYFMGKRLQGLFSLLLSAALMDALGRRSLWLALMAVLIVLGNRKKDVAFPPKLLYNEAS